MLHVLCKSVIIRDVHQHLESISTTSMTWTDHLKKINKRKKEKKSAYLEVYFRCLKTSIFSAPGKRKKMQSAKKCQARCQHFKELLEEGF